MKYPSRLCKGCHEPTDTYRTGCRTCQARHRAIRLHKNPHISSGQPICPRCWRTAGISLPASSIQPENYGQRIAIENQWNPIYSICRACIHAPEGTVPLDSPRVYLPVNPRARRTSKQRIYPSRANPVLFSCAFSLHALRETNRSGFSTFRAPLMPQALPANEATECAPGY